MVGLDAIAIHEGDGCMRAECGDGELVQEITPDLEVCSLLTVRFTRLRPPGFLPLGVDLWCNFRIFWSRSSGSSAARFRGEEEAKLGLLHCLQPGQWLRESPLPLGTATVWKDRRASPAGLVLLPVSQKIIARGCCPLTIHLQPRHARPIDQSTTPRLHLQSLKRLCSGEI